MNEKEVAEIRRRFKRDRNSITHMRGCYVSDRHEIISKFDHSFAMSTQEDSEKIMNALKKTLSGSLGKNLLDLSFTTEQVIQGEEHKLLMDLRSSALTDDGAVQKLFSKIAQTVDLESAYLILLVQDNYDVPYRSKDGAQQDDASSEVYSYILCSICPIKPLKPALSFQQNEFHGLAPAPIVSPPELGFLFPAFDDRSANIYDTLMYARDTAASYQDFTDAVFGPLKPILPAAAQKERFSDTLSEALADECDLDVVQAIHGQLSYVIDEHKASKDPDPLVIGRETVRKVLESCGVSEAHITAFDEKYAEEFGYDTELCPKNLVDPKINVRTPNVVIQVNGNRGDLIKTQVIDGKKYILIRADEGVEVNGVAVKIN